MVNIMYIFFLYILRLLNIYLCLIKITDERI